MSVIYTSKDISKKLKIGKSFVREISKQLEKEDYHFTKNQETRIYSEKDFHLFQMILENYNEHHNLTQSVQNALSTIQKDSKVINQVEEASSIQIAKTSENHSMTIENVVHLEELHNTPEINVKTEVDDETIDHQIITNLNESKLQFEEQTNSHDIVLSQDQSHSNQIIFEEFMTQITNLANQNELILKQNQTLIQQNLEKDQKLEKILHSVEEKSEELHELANVIEEKDEKLEQMFEEIQIREVGRDAQLMRMIREMQETKKMIASSKEKDWKSTLKSLFIKPKTIK